MAAVVVGLAVTVAFSWQFPLESCPSLTEAFLIGIAKSTCDSVYIPLLVLIQL